MSPLRVVLVFVAIAAVASLPEQVLPEQEFDEKSITTEDITAFLQQNAEQAKTDPDTALVELTAMIRTAPKRDISKLEEAINDLIKQVKKDHQADQVSSQAKVDKAGQQLQKCGEKPEVDQTKKAARDAAQTKQDEAEGDVKKKNTGKVSYNLGDTTSSSAAGVTAVANEMTDIKKAFDALLSARLVARNALKLAQGELDAANTALYNNKHQCFCLNKGGFDSLFTTLNDASERNHELAHFKTVQCLMTEYKKGNMHNNAIGQCKDEYDKLMTDKPTKGLNDASGKVSDDRFTECAKHKRKLNFRCSNSPDMNTLLGTDSAGCAADAAALNQVSGGNGFYCTNYGKDSYNNAGNILRQRERCNMKEKCSGTTISKDCAMKTPSAIAGLMAKAHDLSFTCRGHNNDKWFGDGRSVTLDDCTSKIDKFNDLTNQ